MFRDSSHQRHVLLDWVWWAWWVWWMWMWVVVVVVVVVVVGVVVGCGGGVVWWVWWWWGRGIVGRRTRISPILFFTDMCNIHGIQKIYSSLDGPFLST